MRIVKVRFKNLNSLAGEWEIDLSHPAYTADGIFTITGPTGAGKTTILDAICLALYGRTPRLSRITKNNNEIISRQSSDCFAEVTFETQAGLFRCHWSQHRARKKSDGELQQPKHEIVNAATDEIIESNLRGVASQIEAVTGMDFDRFTRSMMLAQGGFAAFLQATADDRAPILERITGTEIYSRISERVHELQRDEREKLKLLQAETQGIITLTSEQEQEIQAELQAENEKEKRLSAQVVTCEKAITWLKDIASIEQEISSLAHESSLLQNEVEGFKPHRQSLNQALKAATLDGSYAALKAVRKQQADDNTALLVQEEALPKLRASATSQSELLQLAELKTQQAKAALSADWPIIQQVRSLDQSLATQKQKLLELKETAENAALKIATNIKAQEHEQEKHSAASVQLKQVNAYLQEQAADEWLVSGLTGLEQQINGLLAHQKEKAQIAQHHKTAAAAYDTATLCFSDAQQQCLEHSAKQAAAAQTLQQAKDQLAQLLNGRLLREYRAEQQGLLREQAYLATIAQLEERRAQLEQGKPCPLCGATEHPFVVGNIPEKNHIEQQIQALEELIEQAEEAEESIKQHEQHHAEAKNLFLQLEKQQQQALYEKSTAEKTLGALSAQLEQTQKEFIARKETVLRQLIPLKVLLTDDASITAALKALQSRQQKWLEQVQKKAEIHTELFTLQSEMTRLGAVIETQKMALQETQNALDALGKEQQHLQKQRATLYGEKQPNTEEQRLNQAIAAAEKDEKQIRERHQQQYQQWQAAQTNFETLTQRINQRIFDQETAEKAFSAALLSAGFPTEVAFLDAILTPPQREQLATKAKHLDDSSIKLHTKRQDRENRLATEIAKGMTNSPLSELEPQLKDGLTALAAVRHGISGMKHKLNENAAAKLRIQDKQIAIEAQQKECQRWGSLHELIGSADGKKFRNFAQGLTFEIMVGHANQQLRKMTERYLLVRDSAQPLELNVMDSYQAGEVRSTKNLSGGESFIISLALALGLSQMASKNVRVDSLFLDEGFGTLDEEALDTALETLAGLQQEGKLIGVISHVQALKERISTQIQVLPHIGGRSQITGPGVSSVC